MAPANATTILVYKVFNDGFVGLDLGGSAAQSVILMFLVIGMTVVQFRFIERKVQDTDAEGGGMIEQRPLLTALSHVIMILWRDPGRLSDLDHLRGVHA